MEMDSDMVQNIRIELEGSSVSIGKILVVLRELANKLNVKIDVLK